MFTVYVIKSLTKKYRYIGLTNNFHRRLKQHNAGTERTTKPYRPFKTILTKEFYTRSNARTYEKRLKSGIGREYLDTL